MSASLPPAVLPSPSPVEAANQAIAHVRRHLFPIRFERWLALGFTAFLDQCGRGGGSSPGGVGSPGSGGGHGGGGPDLSDIAAWVSGHVGLIIGVAALALTVTVAFTALVLWINSRGIFMYLDNVATGRADISRPWHEHAERAGSLFAWRFAIAVGTLLAVLMLLVFGAIGVLTLVRGQKAPGIVLVLLGVAWLLVLCVLLLGASLLSVALRDFVAPIQWQRGVPCGEAVRLFLVLLRAHPGVFALYLLLKIVYVVAAGVVFLLVCCLVCCCVVVPVIGQTLLQPLFYFERAWSLYLLRQLGYDLITDAR